MKILVATIGFGSGHNKAAEAFAEAIPAGFPGAEVEVIDFLKWERNIWDDFTTRFYFTVIKYIPSVYHFVYKNLAELKPLHNMIFRTYIKKMERFLRQYPAELIVSTHVFCAKASIEVKAKNPCIKNVWGILTDFMDDRYWNTLALDRFFVATEELKAKLIKKGVDRETIEVAPIPVRSAFYRKKERSELSGKIDKRLDPSMFTVLVLGGGNGLGCLYDITRCLAGLPVQVLVVTGINMKLKETLEGLEKEHPNIHVFGYIDNIHDLMDISDVCITKPGGVTIAECLAKKIQIVIYGKPLPGPETENIDYLVRNKGSEFCSKPEELQNVISGRIERFKACG